MKNKEKLIVKIIILILVVISLIFVCFRRVNTNINNMVEDTISNNIYFEILVEPNENATSAYDIQKRAELKEEIKADLFFYKVNNVRIRYNNQILKIEDAINNDMITLEDILAKSKYDCENGIATFEKYNASTNLYRYENYTIQEFYERPGVLNIYIGYPNMAGHEGL